MLGTVILDPGHGGSSVVGGSSPNNAVSHSGVKEKRMTLDFARRTKAALEALAQEAGETIEVFLTRTSDVNVGLAARANVARDKGADLFLSLHFNACNRASRGVETWIRTQSQNVNFAQDFAFAERIQGSVFDAVASLDGGTNDRGVKQSGFAVLSDPSLGNTATEHKCRAALLEIEFIDVPAVDALFNTSPIATHARDVVARAIARAIIQDLQA